MFRVMEYDPFYYDGGISKWCEWSALIAAGALSDSTSENNINLFGVELDPGVLVGLAWYAFCTTLVINDEVVGEHNYFESVVASANANKGTQYTFTDSQFEIKVVVNN